ncbi:MAG TPA: site-2 protease family protein [Candidatus Magasanikbacteria bacterium]|nr:site-2 protease family protein [Candidatus Magasanikbacteria bacterium]
MMILSSLFFLVVIIVSAIMHEYAHGWMADRLGDPTARLAGRLTLNPIAHIDPMGTIFMPLILLFVSGGSFMFAFAKPVPFNPYNLRNGKWGPAYVALAGPLSNLLLAAVFGALVRFLPFSVLTSFFSLIVYANVLLATFNLVPIPPLDGSKVLFAVLPPSYSHVVVFLERYSLIILLAFLFFGASVLSPITMAVYSFFVGGVGLF